MTIEKTHSFMMKIQGENPSLSLAKNGRCRESLHGEETFKQILQRLSESYCISIAHEHANDEWRSAVQSGMELNTYFRRLNAGNRQLAVELLQELAAVQELQEAMPMEKK